MINKSFESFPLKHVYEFVRKQITHLIVIEAFLVLQLFNAAYFCSFVIGVCILRDRHCLK